MSQEIILESEPIPGEISSDSLHRVWQETLAAIEGLGVIRPDSFRVPQKMFTGTDVLRFYVSGEDAVIVKAREIVSGAFKETL